MADETGIRHQLLQQIAHICVEQGVRNVIISPGSRSAPLTTAFARHSDLCCRVVIDERAAAFVALGLAQQSGMPTILVCTSGTAALNYSPAVAEAFYQRVPLLLFTADRPPEWIDQQDNQTLHQAGLYEPHVRGSFALPVSVAHPDAQWHAARIVSEAVQRSQHPTSGPVHINVPLREPLYVAKDAPLPAPQSPRIIRRLPARSQLDAADRESLLDTWRTAQRKLIAVGMHAPDPQLNRTLRALSADPGVAVIGDITANIFPAGTELAHADAILGTRRDETLCTLAPDLLVTLGGPLVSKYLKLFLRRHRPPQHWHVDNAGAVVDTYQALTHVIPADPASFLAHLQRDNVTEGMQTGGEAATDYRDAWWQREMQARTLLHEFFATAPFGEFQAVYRILQALPPSAQLQVGNSMAIRYVNFIALTAPAGVAPAMDQPGPRTVYANRGVSGIDGTVSTAVGAALATDDLTVLITGDLGFFDDRNGLWHDHVPDNLRIVVLNNHGGGIFDLIDGPDRLAAAERETFFLTPQPLTARRTAADHGCDYVSCARAAELDRALDTFWQPRPRAAILEIETDMAVNTRVFQEFKERLATNDE